MEECEAYKKALKAELSKAGLKMKDVAKDLGVPPNQVSLAVGYKYRPARGLMQRIARWLYDKNLDVYPILTAYFAGRDELPIGWLENPEARRRLAAFAARLWIEERDIERE